MSLLFTNTEDIIRSRDPGEDLLETHGSTRSGMSTSLECHLKIYSASDFLNVPNSGTGNIIMEEDGPVIPLRNGTSSCNASRSTLESVTRLQLQKYYSGSIAP